MDRSSWNHMNYYQSYESNNNNLQTNIPIDPKYHSKGIVYNNSVAGTFQHQNGMMVNYPVYPSTGRFCSTVTRPTVEQVHCEKPASIEPVSYPNSYYNGGGYSSSGGVAAAAAAATDQTKTYYDLSNSCHYTQQQNYYNAQALYQKSSKVDWNGAGVNFTKASFNPNPVPPYHQNPLLARSCEVSCNTNKPYTGHTYVNNYPVSRPAEPAVVNTMNLNYPPYGADGHHEYHQYVRQSTNTSNKPADINYEYYNQKSFYQPVEYVQRNNIRPTYYNPAVYYPKAAVDPRSNVVPPEEQRSLNYVSYPNVNRLPSDLYARSYHNQTAVTKVDEVQHCYSEAYNQSCVNQNYQYAEYYQNNTPQGCTYNNGSVTKETEAVVCGKDVHHFYSMNRSDVQTDLTEDNNVPGKTLREFLSSWNDVDDEELPSKSFVNLISTNTADNNDAPQNSALIESTPECIIDSSEINNNYDYTDKVEQIEDVHSGNPDLDVSKFSKFHLKYIKRKRLRKLYFQKSIKRMPVKKGVHTFQHLHMIMFLLPYLPKNSITKILSKPNTGRHAFWLLFLHSNTLSVEVSSNKFFKNITSILRRVHQHHNFSLARNCFKISYNKMVKSILESIMKEIPVILEPLSLQELCFNRLNSIYNVHYIDSLSTVCAMSLHKNNNRYLAQSDDIPSPVYITEDIINTKDLDIFCDSSGTKLLASPRTPPPPPPSPCLLDHPIKTKNCSRPFTSSFYDLSLGQHVEVVEDNAPWYRKNLLVEKYRHKGGKLTVINGLQFYKSITKKRCFSQN